MFSFRGNVEGSFLATSTKSEQFYQLSHLALKQVLTFVVDTLGHGKEALPIDIVHGI